MRKILYVGIVAIAGCISLVACGKADDENKTGENEPIQTVVEDETAQTADESETTKPVSESESETAQTAGENETAKPVSESESETDEAVIGKLLRDDEIKQIHVTSSPVAYDLTIDDADKIQEVRDYFDSLVLEEGDCDIVYSTIMSVEVTYGDNSSEKILCNGDVFKKDEGPLLRSCNTPDRSSFEIFVSGVEKVTMTESDNHVSDFIDELKSGDADYSKILELTRFDKCVNVTPQNISEKYGFDIFRFEKLRSSYLMYDGNVYGIGDYLEGDGLTDFMLADLNNDGQKELCFTFSSGIGNSGSKVGCFDFAKKEMTVFAQASENSELILDYDNGLVFVYKVDKVEENGKKIDHRGNDKFGVLRYEDEVELTYFYESEGKYCSKVSEKEVI